METKEIYGEVTVQILRLETNLMPEVEYVQYEQIAEEIEALILKYQVLEGWEIDVVR